MAGDQDFLAVENASMCTLNIASQFNELTIKEKKYAHYLSRYATPPVPQILPFPRYAMIDDLKSAAFAGTRILLRQVSLESEGIFDLLMALFHLCGGAWSTLHPKIALDEHEIQWFLEYASQFLDALGDYAVSTLQHDRPCTAAGLLISIWARNSWVMVGSLSHDYRKKSFNPSQAVVRRLPSFSQKLEMPCTPQRTLLWAFRQYLPRVASTQEQQSIPSRSYMKLRYSSMPVGFPH